jgi:SAM-dependent methyltransferase
MSHPAEVAPPRHYNDDPAKDYRGRYGLPIHWIEDPCSHFGIDYAGYVELTLSLLPAVAAGEERWALDAGCGDGFISGLISKKGYRVVGVDYTESAIKYARLLVPEGEFHVGDLRDLPAPVRDRKFDTIVFVEALEHLPVEYHEPVLRELRGLLKPGGVMILSVPSNRIPVSRRHYKHFSPEETRGILGRCGFEVQSMVGQHRRCIITGRLFWKLIHNHVWDFPFIRAWVRRRFLRKHNVVADLNRASRFLTVATVLQA